jgi:hypothetical protein
MRDPSMSCAACVCGKYDAAARSLDPVFGYRMAIAKWSWNGVGTLRG